MNAGFTDEMDAACSPHALLDDLRCLSRTGRMRYMRKLSREELIQALSVALEDADLFQKPQQDTGIFAAPVAIFSPRLTQRR